MVCVVCKECGASFNKPPSQMRSKKGNNFCSRSCSVRHNNLNKEQGTKRSRMERWLESRIGEEFPDLEVHYNRKDTIGSELDIYIPSLKLAFEINGDAHYKPIYGAETLKGKQDMDEEKRNACRGLGIDLNEVNISGLKDFRRNPNFETTVKQVMEKISARLFFQMETSLSESHPKS